AALVKITKVLGYELGKDRIRVNAIAPGVIATRLTEPWLKTDEQRADRASFYPLGRFGVPDDIAAAAVYLCSDEAGWVSGNVLYVTGGQLATSDVFRWGRKHNPGPDASRVRRGHLGRTVTSLGLVWLTAFNLRVILFAIPPTLPEIRS